MASTIAVQRIDWFQGCLYSNGFSVRNAPETHRPWSNRRSRMDFIHGIVPWLVQLGVDIEWNIRFSSEQNDAGKQKRSIWMFCAGRCVTALVSCRWFAGLVQRLVFYVKTIQRTEWECLVPFLSNSLEWMITHSLTVFIHRYDFHENTLSIHNRAWSRLVKVALRCSCISRVDFHSIPTLNNTSLRHECQISADGNPRRRPNTSLWPIFHFWTDGVRLNSTEDKEKWSPI